MFLLQLFFFLPSLLLPPSATLSSYIPSLPPISYSSIMYFLNFSSYLLHVYSSRSNANVIEIFHFFILCFESWHIGVYSQLVEFCSTLLLYTIMSHSFLNACQLWMQISSFACSNIIHELPPVVVMCVLPSAVISPNQISINFGLRFRHSRCACICAKLILYPLFVDVQNQHWCCAVAWWEGEWHISQ